MSCHKRLWFMIILYHLKSILSLSCPFHVHIIMHLCSEKYYLSPSLSISLYKKSFNNSNAAQFIDIDNAWKAIVKSQRDTIVSGKKWGKSKMCISQHITIIIEVYSIYLISKIGPLLVDRLISWWINHERGLTGWT